MSPSRYATHCPKFPIPSHSWEPEENLDNCKRLLQSFWDDIGLDNGDYEEGYKVKATPSWISKCSSS